MKLFQEWLQSAPDVTHRDFNKEILLIGMSATALESEQEEAFKYGMHFFCPKPVSLDLLAIILNAKKDAVSNEEAVNRICDLTGTASDACENTDGLTGIIKNRTNIEEDSEALSGNRGKWSLFRSHKQSTSKRIHPEADNSH